MATVSEALTTEFNEILCKHRIGTALGAQTTILADYLLNCLKAFHKAILHRDKAVGLSPSYRVAEHQSPPFDECDGQVV